MKASFNSIILTLGLTGLFIATSASASPNIERLLRADVNGDGNISKQELLDLRKSTFKRLDRNEDGFVDERDEPRLGPAKRLFADALAKLKSADANGDGRVSKNELLDSPSPMFETGDIDGDGVLSTKEIEALRKAGGNS